MHKITSIINEVINRLSTLSVNGANVSVERNSPEQVTEYPTIRVVLGTVSNNISSFEEDEREVSIYIDSYLQSTSNNIEDLALQIGDDITASLREFNTQDLDVESVRFIGSEEIAFNNKEDAEFTAMHRNTYQFKYMEASTY